MGFNVRYIDIFVCFESEHYYNRKLIKWIYQQQHTIISLFKNPHLEFHAIDIIPYSPVIHIYYHVFREPQKKSSYSSNFVYFEPIISPFFDMDLNIIRKVGVEADEQDGDVKRDDHKNMRISK